MTHGSMNSLLLRISSYRQVFCSICTRTKSEPSEITDISPILFLQSWRTQGSEGLLGTENTNIEIQVIYITCSWQGFVFPILQSSPDVAQIFWTCQLHTTWQLLHHNGGSEHPAVSWGWIIWKWQQGCWVLTAAILFQKLPGSVKLTCPENMCHIRSRLENWKPEDLAYQDHTYIALNPISTGSVHDILAS